MKNVLVIGNGEIGRPLAELIEKSGNYVVFIKDVKQIKIPEPIDILHICIPYSEGFSTIVDDYAREYRPKLIIINSTVRPGTTDAIAKKIGIPAVHSPVRGRHPNMKEGLLKFVKFVGGEKQAALLAKEHFERIGLTVMLMDSAINTEIGKLLETTYYGIDIAAHQEMYRICKVYGADFIQAVTLYNATCTMDIAHKVPRPLMYPGKIGGHCVLPNIEIIKLDVMSELLDFVLKSSGIEGIEFEKLKQKIKEIEKTYRKDTDRDVLKIIKENARNS